MSTEKLTVKVARKIFLTPDVAFFELVDKDDKPLPSFTAGSHIDVNINENLIRQYSLCNDPDENHRYCLSVKRDQESRGGSIAMHEDVEAGQLLEISTPRNAFNLMEGHDHTLLIAGGIGITPLLSMARRLYSLKEKFDLHYCLRTQADAAFKKEIDESPFINRVFYHYDDGLPEQRLDLEALLWRYMDNTQLYVCGPKGLMDAVVGQAEKSYPKDKVHLEVFSGIADAGLANSAFRVKIASSGEEYEVPEDQTIYEVLSAHNIDIPISCEQGVCGTCLVNVVQGIPDHRDSYLMDFEKEENKQMTICCSRALSEIIILDI